MLALLEQAVARALQLDPATAHALTKLNGRVFLFDCTDPSISVYLLPGSSGLELRGYHEGRVDTSLRGTASDFLDLARAADPASALINGGLELRGDSTPLLALQACIAGLELDWEAPLVTALGDVAGHQLANALRSAFSFGQRSATSLRRQLSEYIHEEGRLAPSAAEIEDFYEDIRQVQQRSERLEAKLRRLQAKLGNVGSRQ